MKTVGIYIQIPFCQTKCTYCNFHTGVFSKKRYAPYVDALCREISSVARGISLCHTVDTIYIGGGTPSLLDAAALARILHTVRASFRCDLQEVTLEADPETVTPEKAVAWCAAGMDRISLGVQSFNDAELRTAGRLHRREDVFRAVGVLRAAGFQNISFDLIAGLPHQTAASWENSLEQIARLRPEHVSIYLLEIDEGSRLGREVLAGGHRYSADALPSDDDMAAFYERACERLAAEGYEHYEISNWGLAGFHSRHNVKYWRREPYLGFGAGAHSFNGVERWANVHDPIAYLVAIEQGRLPIGQFQRLTAKEALEEELFLGLRQLEGIDFARIEQAYNVDLSARLARLHNLGLVEPAPAGGTTVRLAPTRLTVANEAFLDLLA